jgi:hemerythrin-like metal-binding protein
VPRCSRPSIHSLSPQLDQDHRALFKLLDRAGTLRRESDVEDLNPLLDALIVYSFDHFAREEGVMKAFGYPDTVPHSAEHLAMRSAFIESLRKVAKGSMAIPVFIQHLKESFIYHYERDDMTFVTWQMNHREHEPNRAAGIHPGSLKAMGVPET